MTIACAAPDGDLGVVIRLASYLDCRSHALGENGFRALAGSQTGTALLTGAMTIFVALLGYRMMLGAAPNLRDGAGSAARLGIVLALVSSWPAFDALVYRVATDGPQELAALLLPAAGLPEGDMGRQVQAAYDLVRQDPRRTIEAARSAGGPSPEAKDGQGGNATQPPPPRPAGLQPLPRAATLLVVSTVGLASSLELAVAFLIAVAPLAALCLLFQATAGIFTGWLRGLAGAVLAELAIRISGQVELAVLGSELSRIEAARAGALAPEQLDPQALTTIIVVFCLVAAAMVLAAFRMTGAIRLAWSAPRSGETAVASRLPADVATASTGRAAGTASAGQHHPSRSREGGVAQALVVAARRDRVLAGGHGEGPARASTATLVAEGKEPEPAWAGLAATGRRVAPRRSQSTRRRDDRR